MFGLRQARHEDHRNRGKARGAFEPAADFEAVHSRHHRIKQYYVGCHTIHQVHRARAGLRDQNRIAGALQGFVQHP